MRTLLILGSKPEPVLPPRSSYDEIACANASGFSAAQHDLPIPAYTVMSAILTSGLPSGQQSLQALSGLKTETLYFFPRPLSTGNLLKRFVQYVRTLKMKPFYFKRRLRSLPYEYSRFINFGYPYYATLIRELCDYNEEILEQIKKKQPSTGIMALAIGIAQKRYDRFIISGFSFELTHAYAYNPEIEERSTKISRHVDTDITVMNYLSVKFGNVYTTEKTVNERAEVPMLQIE